MEIKFTTDGRKVAVLGKLNSTETIVQEIFIINEQEIPSGENFIVKSLHDAPAVSWRQKNLKETELNYDIRLKTLNKEYESLESKYRDMNKVLRKKIEWAAEAINNINPEVFKLLSDFMTSEIKFLVVDSGWDMEILPFDNAISQFTDYNYGKRYVEEIKMITLFGRADKGLSYQLNRYSDGSGSHNKIMPFNTEEEAKKYISEWINTGELSSYKIKASVKYDIKIKKEIIESYQASEIEKYKDAVHKQKVNLDSAIDLLRKAESGDFNLPIK